MTDDFDPYYQWLGIPPKHQPPNHYRLLAIEEFESNLDVIENAADQRMQHVRSFQNGPHGEVSQRILNEITAAKLCLLNLGKKAEYDRKLRAEKDAAEPRRLKPLPRLEPTSAAAEGYRIAADELPAMPAAGRPRRRLSPHQSAMVGAGLGLLVVAVSAYVMLSRIDWTGDHTPIADKPDGPQPLETTNPENDPAADSKVEPGGHGPPADITGEDPANEPAKTLKTPVSPSTPPKASEQPAAPADLGSSKQPVAPTPPDRRRQRIPEPDQAAQERATAVLKATFHSEYARKQRSEIRQFALDLFLRGMETNDDPAAKFVLYREASLLTARTGDIHGASCVVDQMHREFDARITRQIRDVLQAAAASNLPAAGQTLLARCAMMSADLAVGEGELPIAAELLAIGEAASAKLDAPLLAELKSRRRELDTIGQSQADYERSVSKLHTTPDDPAAQLTVAKYLCFVKGDWTAGLPVLARSGDSRLKRLAELDLASPAEATAQAELAAAWWDLAQESAGIQRRRMLTRACRWYNQAMLRLSGLTLSVAQERVAETARQYPELTLYGDVSVYAAYAGLWEIDYTNGAKRRYIIDPRGAVYTLTEDRKLAHGRLQSKEGKFALRLAIGHGWSPAAEDIELRNGELQIDHYNPPGKLSCTGVGRHRSLPESRPGATDYADDFSAFAGIWLVTYTNGDQRLYVIGPRGSAVGSGFHQLLEGRMRRNGEHLLLDCGEDKLERVWINEGAFRSDHYFPASTTYPNGAPLLHGRGVSLWR